jgi:MFS family permease
MLLPGLPDYLTSLGGAEYKGLIVAAFTVTAMISRPFSGKLSDKIGRVPVIMVGSFVCLCCSLLYPFASTIVGFLLLRLVHGFSTGFTPTGQTAYVSDIIPTHRRGEAMGMLGTFSVLGMVVGPAVESSITNNFGIGTLFYVSAACALASILILVTVSETLVPKTRFTFSVLSVKKSDLFEPRVIVPCVVMALYAYSYGAMIAFIPDLAKSVSLDRGILFACLTVASLTVRLLGGKASDRWGRRPVLQCATLAITVSMLMIAFTDSKFILMAGVMLYGFAQGTTSPTLLAWATDLSTTHHKGRAVASLYIAMEFGIGAGAAFSGLIYGNGSQDFYLMFSVCSLLAASAFAYLTFYRPAVNVAS